MSPNAIKAANYVSLLDEVRCEGDWEAVPEYVRKVRKHAPDRICLTLTAETELAIEKTTRTQPSAGATNTTAEMLDAANLVPKLLAVVEEENTYLQDRYQARVCVGWLHWVVGEYGQAFEQLPKSLEMELGSPSENPLVVSDWTRVCALKSAYLRANCLARNGNKKEALAVFEEGLPCLTSALGGQEARKQLRYWSELFLTEYCMLFSHTLEQNEASLEDPNCLASLRSWARYWEGTKGAAVLGGHGFRGSVPRRRIWYEYYSVLSALVEDDLPYPTAYAPATTADTSARDQLRMELKRVEAVYEALLLEETTFPRADEEREEVEDFVRLVMQNWAVLKGRGWREQDLGHGGKESMSRGVLDILYRASTKTYHSTAILRHLFTVHLAVAEFDLAFKAFDSYLDLVRKGKARVVKTEKEEPNLDDDGIVLETISECISALCRYGDRLAAEKAYGLSLQLEQALLEVGRPETIDEEVVRPPPQSNLIAKTGGSDIALRVLALAWQAVGLAHAQWARMTSDSAARSEIQGKAVRCLRKSLSPEFGKSANLRGVFSLGLLLAEQRELGAAIELVKGALLSNKTPDADQDLLNGPYWRERAMIPLWHLLSLLLSARQDYVMAARACEGAFEQFKDPAVLFGSENLYRSEHLNEAETQDEKGAGGRLRGLIDDMDDFEKERILEVKMTQLALVELLESPKVAVNASLELLTLFARLFGQLKSSSKASATGGAKTVGGGDLPRSSTGTLRSIKGSIFGRGGDRSGRPPTRYSSTTEKPGTAMSRPQTMQTTTSRDAPTIHVTRDSEDGRRSRRRSQSGKRQSLQKSEGSRRRAVSSGGAPTTVDGEHFYTPFDDGRTGSDFFSRRRLSSSAGPPVSMSRQASQVESILSSSASTTRARGRSFDAGGGEMGVDGIEPSSSLMPLIQFPKEHEKRRRSAMLIEVWLMIAGFYRRTRMFEDAKGAVAEAQKLVQALELDVMREPSGGVSMRSAGWAGKKSVDELWGDIWTEMGYLSLARDNAYAARADFEAALSHFPDHPAAIVGLSNILLDIYSEKRLPPPAIPRLELADGKMFPEKAVPVENKDESKAAAAAKLPHQPLGLVDTAKDGRLPAKKSIIDGSDNINNSDNYNSRRGSLRPDGADDLPPPYKATSLPVIDRLAARDRAFGLLSGLTKLGTAWNNTEAWFALARAHEESGQPDKAKEVLWWCVELEEAAGVRPWDSVATGGYVL